MQTIWAHVDTLFLQGQMIARGIGSRVNGSILA